MSKHDVSLAERTYVCSCGYQEDRDVHSAKNMLTIKNLVFSQNNFLPTGHREVTLTEFKTAIGSSDVAAGKSGRRSEKITPFRV